MVSEQVVDGLLHVKLAEVIWLSCDCNWRLRMLALPHQQIPHLYSNPTLRQIADASPFSSINQSQAGMFVASKQHVN